jgi:NitT/TauT family transport system substrate-binding protein
MRVGKWRQIAMWSAVLAMVLAACGGGSSSDTSTTAAAEQCTTPDDVRVQLQWFAQSQFAGYYVALDKGFYEDQCLNVEILEGGVDIVPQQVLATGGAEFGLAWVPKALVSRDAGANIVNIAQVFERSGTLEVSFADSGIASPEARKWATGGLAMSSS